MQATTFGTARPRVKEPDRHILEVQLIVEEFEKERPEKGQQRYISCTAPAAAVSERGQAWATLVDPLGARNEERRDKRRYVRCRAPATAMSERGQARSQLDWYIRE